MIKPEGKNSCWNIIKGIEKLSLNDWENHLSMILFLGGCNYRCPTCHNKTVAFTPDELISITEYKILKTYNDKINWYEGIVICGGEPTIHGNDLISLLTKLKKKTNLPIKLDTNGSNPFIVKYLLEKELIDTVALDVKGPYHLYPNLVGNKDVTETIVKSNMNELFKLAVAKKYLGKFIFRTTLVPMLSREDIKIVESYIPKQYTLKLQQYIKSDINH